MKTIASLGLLLLFSITAFGQNLTNINVFVTAAEPETKGGFVTPDPNPKAKLDSVKDLKKNLVKKVRLVDRQEDADVVLEVLARGGEATGDTTTNRDALGQVHSRQDSVALVRVALIVGDYTTEIDGRSFGPPSGLGAWNRAAIEVADQVDKWIKENQTKLLSNRSK
jgi:hypothetical protein